MPLPALRSLPCLALAAAFLLPGCAMADAPTTPASRPLAGTDIPTGDVSPVDYSKPESWICGMGKDDPSCRQGADALVIDAKGNRSIEKWTPTATTPPIDCFYIYTSASMDPTLYSDLDPVEEKAIVVDQMAMLSNVCRPVVPIYHSITGASGMASMENSPLDRQMEDPDKPFHLAFPMGIDIPARDIEDAWAYYLAHINKGRGVVILGHSQSALLAKRLVEDAIDGKPGQDRIVAVYTAGNLDMDKTSFKAMPFCADDAQVGCYVAWSSYLSTDLDHWRFWGRTPGIEPVCVNPAAPGGGKAELVTYIQRPASAAPDTPPLVKLVGQISAECVRDERGAVLAVHLSDGTPAATIIPEEQRRWREPLQNWGTHDLDWAFVLGNLRERITRQSATWVQAHKN